MSNEPEQPAVATPYKAWVAREKLLNAYVGVLREADVSAINRRASLTRYYAQSHISQYLQDIRRANARLATLETFDADGADPGRLASADARCARLGATLSHRPGIAALMSIQLPAGVSLGALGGVGFGLISGKGHPAVLVWDVVYGGAVLALLLLAVAIHVAADAFRDKRDLFKRRGVYGTQGDAFKAQVLTLCQSERVETVPRHLWMLDGSAAVLLALLFAAVYEHFHIRHVPETRAIVAAGVLALSLGLLMFWQTRTLGLRFVIRGSGSGDVASAQ